MLNNKSIVYGVIVTTIMLLSSCAPENNTELVKGCLNTDAVNYNPSANVDDGSCVVIPNKQYGMFFKYTATWCFACGGYGMNAFNQFYEQNKGNIIAFTVQTDDDLTTPRNNPVYIAFSQRWDYNGTPTFVANNTYVDQDLGQASTEISNIIANNPSIGTGVHWTIGGGSNWGKLNINAYAKAFSSLSGEYKMGVYIIAKKIIAPQKVGDQMVNEFEHHKVLLGFAGDDPWGETIITSGASAGEVFHKGYVVPLEPNWKVSDLEVVSIIWKKNGANWDFVNATPN